MRIDDWTGALACALQEALRMSNLTFAGRLGLNVKTVADWHADPAKRPRPETRQLLDSLLERASPAERERFAALAGLPAPDAGATATGAGPQAGPQTVNITGHIVSTGAYATIDARTVNLPAEAVRPPAQVAAGHGVNNLPAAIVTFVDRTDDLAQLATVFDREPPGSPVSVHGLGGTGKTSLALRYADGHRDRYSPIWWIQADSPVSVTTGLASLAARLDPYAHLTAQTSADAAAWAIAWLQAHDNWLLILDDASPRSVETVLGTLAGGRHLITTRRATGWHRIARPLPLAVLPPDAALELLTAAAGDGEADREPLEQIAAELGYLPLALDQAAAYIRATAITPAAYLDRLHRYPARMFATPAAPDAGEADRERTVARIWQLSLAAIADDPLAGEILRVLAWLAPDPIPRDLAYQLDDDPLAVDDALAMLSAYSMVTLTPEAVTIHRLVQAVARTPDPADPHRTPEAVTRARDRAARLLLDSLPYGPLFNVPGWPRWRALIAHATAYTDHAGPDTPETASILTAISAYLQGDGHQDQAVTAAQRAVDASRALHGPDAPETLIARSFLASAYRAAGDLTAAGPLHEANLADSERVLGPDHPETLVARANLAFLCAMAGDEQRALALNERNLADSERVLGPDHPNTLNARANLASSYRAAGDLPRAIRLHEQTAGEYARVYGPDHSETVTALSNLAVDYQLAGDLDRAIALYRRVLADRERLYGPDHDHTALARQLLDNAEQQAADSRRPDE